MPPPTYVPLHILDFQPPPCTIGITWGWCLTVHVSMKWGSTCGTTLGGHKRIPQGDYRNVHNAGKWSPFQGAQGRKEAEWRAVRCFPSHGITATFRSRQSEARHPNGCVVSHYSSEGTRRRWLGEAGASTAVEVHKWDTIYEANPKCRRDELHRTLVHGRVASDQWRLQRISWMSNDDGEGSSYQFARQNEV
jgi:hypothetical protein